jgi:hypothetical protein
MRRTSTNRSWNEFERKHENFNEEREERLFVCLSTESDRFIALPNSNRTVVTRAKEKSIRCCERQEENVFLVLLRESAFSRDGSEGLGANTSMWAPDRIAQNLDEEARRICLFDLMPIG